MRVRICVRARTRLNAVRPEFSSGLYVFEFLLPLAPPPACLHFRALRLDAHFFHASVPRQRGRRAAEPGILYAQAADAAARAVGRPRLLQAGPQRAADHRRYRRPVRAERRGHRHGAAVGGGRADAAAAQVRLAAGVRHRYLASASAAGASCGTQDTRSD